jgi:hypothetical protein
MSVIVPGFYHRVRELAKLNCPKLKGHPPFSGRKQKPDNDVLIFFNYLLTVDTFTRQEFLPLIFAALNWCGTNPEQGHIILKTLDKTGTGSELHKAISDFFVLTSITGPE